MSKEVQEVVQARRFEVLGRRGNVKATFGAMDETLEQGERAGLELYDDFGSVWAWLIFEERFGTELVMAVGGNHILVLSALGGPGSATAGASITLFDLDANPVSQWRVSERDGLDARAFTRGA